jgi:hypothetical protein
MSADPFVAQLAGLCRAEPTRAKWVFVPTHAIGLTIGDRLVREGCDWANLRFVTPLDIATVAGAQATAACTSVLEVLPRTPDMKLSVRPSL